MRSIGIDGTALKWLKSYISNRTHTVRIGSHNSHRTLTESGILQGSVLGPVLFSIYTLPLGAIFRKHQLQYHLYADDAQLYVDLSGVPDGETADAVCRVERCIEEARLWMSDHNLLLNETRPKQLSSRHQIVNIGKTSLVLVYADCAITNHPKPWDYDRL